MDLATLQTEFDHEMASTRQMLACVPSGQFAWAPHHKSASLGKLANHLAAMPVLATAVFQGQAKRMPDAASTPELLAAFDQHLAQAQEAIAGTTAEHLDATIPALNHMTRAAVLRSRAISHMIHHRGQLSVYLRLLDVAVPGVYGPSADEKPAAL